MDKAYEGIVNEQTGMRSDLSISDVCCRICLEIGAEELIFPCLCRGTGKFIHDSCLKSWILSKFSDLSKAQCEICKFSYNIKALSRRECNPKKGMSKEPLWCCIIPILILVLIIMGIILFVVTAYHIDLRTERENSIGILVICTIPTVGTAIFLVVALYKVCLVKTFKEWSVSSYIRPASSIESAPGENFIHGK